MDMLLMLFSALAGRAAPVLQASRAVALPCLQCRALYQLYQGSLFLQATCWRWSRGFEQDHLVAGENLKQAGLIGRGTFFSSYA